MIGRSEISDAASKLINGALVAFPTETVYGLGANATNRNAINRVFQVKARPVTHPLIVHISSISQLEKWAIEIPEYAIKLATHYWPGPLTLILESSGLASDLVTGGQKNIGIRIPSHPVALDLLREFEKLGGLGIAAPSANKFGAVSPTTAQDVVKEIGDYLSDNDLVIDGGECLIGIESTIINCTRSQPTILRFGAIVKENAEQVAGVKFKSFEDNERIRVSGQFESHYSPKAEVILDKSAKKNDGFIAFADIPTPNGAIRLSSPNSVEEYGAQLYKSLRLGDELGIKKIFVIAPEGDGLAEAIRDRLNKASAKVPDQSSKISSD